MENKEHPELKFPEAVSGEIPVQANETPVPEETGFVDYFADILPEQPAAEPSRDADPEAFIPEELPVPNAEELPYEETSTPAGTVTADTAVISEIQAAVQNIISQEEAADSAQSVTEESSSEDPYLAGNMAAGFIRGV